MLILIERKFVAFKAYSTKHFKFTKYLIKIHMYNYKLARLKFLLIKVILDSLNILFPVFHGNIICLPSKCGNLIFLRARFYAWFVAELSVDEQFGTFPRCTQGDPT